MTSPEEPDSSSFESGCGLEDASEYSLGGYYPIRRGQFLPNNSKNAKYIVKQKLGWGHFSTVWLAQDIWTKQYRAIKVIKGKNTYYESGQDEIELLLELSNNAGRASFLAFAQKAFPERIFDEKETFCVELVEHFEDKSVNGQHICLVFPILGPSLLDILTHFLENFESGVPLPLVKSITKQILLGLHYIHDQCKMIHTDLKPENVVLEFSEREIECLAETLIKSQKKPISEKFAPSVSSSQKNSFGFLGSGFEIGNVEASASEQSPSKKESPSMLSEESLEDEHPQEFVSCRSTLNPQSPNSLSPSPSSSQIVRGPESILSPKSEEVPQDTCMRWKESVTVRINKHSRVKIVDFGNACRINKHFTQYIQTREYRSPEVILGCDYDEKTDLWSLGCMVFELITSNFLFKPEKKENCSKSEEHLFLMMEVLGKLPLPWARKGENFADFFSNEGTLKQGNPKFKKYPLYYLLVVEGKIDEFEAHEIERFLLKMLKFDPRDRASAKELLSDPWLCS